MSPSGIGTILAFLTYLFKTGKAYRTANVYSSMLSSKLNRMEDFDIGKQPLVIRLMRGIFNQQPPKPRYTNMWNVDTVLNFISSLGEIHFLSLSTLSQKTAILLSLTSLFRVSELASIQSLSLAMEFS